MPVQFQVGRLGRGPEHSTSEEMWTNHLPKMLGKPPSQSSTHRRAEQALFLECKLEARVLSAEGLFRSPPSHLGRGVSWTKGGVDDFLVQAAGCCFAAQGASLRNSGPPEPGTTFTGSELIMSFYELWGPRGTRINVKHACQPRSLGECHTLTKLKATATRGRSWGLRVRRCGQTHQ